MDILGSVGKLYTFILLAVLFLGSGLAVWAAINSIMNKREKIKESTDKIKTTLNSSLKSTKNKNILGGINMKNSGFIKLAVFSFIGIIISAAILAALPKYSSSSMNMGTQYGAATMNMQGTPGYSMQAGMNSNNLSSIQQQLNQIQQQINQLQNQMSNNYMSGMQSNSGSMNNSSMNNSSMNNNMNNNSMNNNSSMNSNSMSNSNSSSNSSSMSSMPMM
jgi:hypothetical protein